MINQPEGYLEPNGQGGYDYGYRLKDHLGNIRLTFVDFDHNGSIALSEITEENNYYPFGLKHQGYNNIVNSNTNAVASKFKYNGKELNDELGLDLYDYGARFYDAALGRWHCPDPLAEAYYSYSSYNYTLNNPIRFVDPDGRWVKGAGFFRNISKSDDRINAEDRATEIGGDAVAHKNKNSGGWDVTYTSGEKTDFGNGVVDLKTFNIENYSKKGKNSTQSDGENVIMNTIGKTSDVIIDASKKLNDAVTFPVEMYGASIDFYRNYSDMRNLNWKNSDKYFHAKANFQAAHRGPGGVFFAIHFSNLREIWDQNVKGYPFSDSMLDQKANIFGRKRAKSYAPDQFIDALEPYRPVSLPINY